MNSRTVVTTVVMLTLMLIASNAMAQDLGNIMQDNVADTSRRFGQGWTTLIAIIGYILFPLGLFGIISAVKQKQDFKGPAAALLIGSLALAIVYIPGLFTQTVLRQDAEGMQDLGVQ